MSTFTQQPSCPSLLLAWSRAVFQPCLSEQMDLSHMKNLDRGKSSNSLDNRHNCFHWWQSLKSLVLPGPAPLCPPPLLWISARVPWSVLTSAWTALNGLFHRNGVCHLSGPETGSVPRTKEGTGLTLLGHLQCDEPHPPHCTSPQNKILSPSTVVDTGSEWLGCHLPVGWGAKWQSRSVWSEYPCFLSLH